MNGTLVGPLSHTIQTQLLGIGISPGQTNQDSSCSMISWEILYAQVILETESQDEQLGSHQITRNILVHGQRLRDRF